MAFKGSVFRIVLITVIITVFSFGAGYFFLSKHYLYTALLLLVDVIYIFRMVAIYNQTNKSIALFFDAARNNDASLTFHTSNNKSLQALYDGMNNLNKHIQQIKLQNEYHEKYYKALIQQSATGLVVLNKDNEIELINEITCQYAGISSSSTNMKLLKIKNEPFYDVLCSVVPEQTITFKNIFNETAQLLLFNATEIKGDEQTLKLVSIQDICQELDEKELESYQKLIRILTHEIMNSIAPLTSISKTLQDLYVKDDEPVKPHEVNEVMVATTVQGLKAIGEQGDGLMNFVNSYRRLTKIPDPLFKLFSIEEWIEQLKILFTEKITDNHIYFEIEIQPHLQYITADKNLINQVIVNLVNNAIDALQQVETERKMKLSFSMNQGNRVIIKLWNNGALIPEELQEKIFIPFFTTKENGSGIGLSISRQIMKQHKGSIGVKSDPETGTIFTLEL
ncbi:MAG: HAMP domain-containing sensor histidine kinase [Bacteroidota bacterium]|nr:HAMP domain-containing sensor histidine kinase [Bacteroidota bacterium]